MDFVRSYFGTNEPLTSWTLFPSPFGQINWSDVHFYRSNFLQNPYFKLIPIHATPLFVSEWMVSSQIGSMPIFVQNLQCIITLLGRNNFWVTRAANSLCAFDHSNVSVSDRNSPPCSTEQVIMGSKPFWNFIWKSKKLSITGMLLENISTTVRPWDSRFWGEWKNSCSSKLWTWVT